MDKKYVLTRPWTSAHGISETLYLGYNSFDHIDCVPELEGALVMTKEDAEDWLLIVTARDKWSIKEIDVPEEEVGSREEIKEETPEDTDKGE